MRVLKGSAVKAAAMTVLVPLCAAASGYVVDAATRLPYAPALDRTTVGALFLTGAVAGAGAALRGLHHVLGQHAENANSARIMLQRKVADDEDLAAAHAEIDRLHRSLELQGGAPWTTDEATAAREAIGLPQLEAAIGALSERLDRVEAPVSVRRQSRGKRVTPA